MPRRQRNRATHRRPRPLLRPARRSGRRGDRGGRAATSWWARYSPKTISTSGCSKRTVLSHAQVARASTSRPGRRQTRPRRSSSLQIRCRQRHQIAAQVLAAADQIAQRLQLGRGNDDRPQLPGRVQPRELERVARVGLDPIAGLARDRARRADHHLDPRRPRRPRQPEPRRPGLIDRAHRPRQRLQPLDRRARRPDDLRLEHLTRSQAAPPPPPSCEHAHQAPRNRYRPTRRRSSPSMR